MNRRNFLRGCTALVTAAALPAPVAAAIPIKTWTPVEPRTPAELIADEITRKALALMEASLRPIVERWERDLLTYGSLPKPKGETVRFRRLVEFRVVEPMAPTEEDLDLMSLGLVRRRLMTKAQLREEFEL